MHFYPHFPTFLRTGQFSDIFTLPKQKNLESCKNFRGFLRVTIRGLLGPKNLSARTHRTGPVRLVYESAISMGVTNVIFWQNQGGWAFQETMRRFQWCENLCISKSIQVFQICGSFFVSTCQIQAALSIRWANIILIQFVLYLYILLHMYFHYISAIDFDKN